MLKNAIRSFLGALCSQDSFAGSLSAAMCSLLLLSTGVLSAQAQERRDTTRPVSKISDKDRAREFDQLTAQPPNSIQVQVRYKKEYGYKYDSGVFAGSGPSSCDAFSISAQLDPSVRLEHLYGIHKTDKMRESSGFYICDFLITDLPLNALIKVGVDLAERRSLPFEAWKGGSQAQPPPGQQRTIIIAGGRVSRERRAEDRTVTLTQAQPRATQVFEMVYAADPLIPPNQRVPQTKPPVPPPQPTPLKGGRVIEGNSRISDRVRNSAGAVISSNSIRGTIRWKKAYGMIPMGTTSNRPSPVPCGSFFVAAMTTAGAPGTFGKLTTLKTESAQLNEPNKVPEEGDYYVCHYIITGLPTNKNMLIMAGMGGSLLLPQLDPDPLYHTVPWIGGSQPEPPPGYDRVFIGSRSVTLTDSDSRAVVDFEVVYRPIPAPPR